MGKKGRFLGFEHPHGEVHIQVFLMGSVLVNEQMVLFFVIQDSGAWYSCPGEQPLLYLCLRTCSPISWQVMIMALHFARLEMYPTSLKVSPLTIVGLTMVWKWAVASHHHDGVCKFFLWPCAWYPHSSCCLKHVGSKWTIHCSATVFDSSATCHIKP